MGRKKHYNTRLQATPCQLVFTETCFTIMHIKKVGKIQDLINEFNNEENKSHIQFEYKVGDQVLLESPGILPKLSSLPTEPFAATNV
jgi:hypothetical protein